MFAKSPVLSKCTSCRDGREAVDGLRGGIRFGQSVVSQLEVRAATELTLCGVQFMSQCKGPSIAFLSGYNHFFSYLFEDIDPENTEQLFALFDLVARFRIAPEGFLRGHDRPEAMRSNILGRLPPLRTNSSLVTPLGNLSAG